jgi:ubiquinone/menaquinone biosynthesis C-methylase UbiE
MARSSFAEHGVGIPRLFNFDLPYIKKTSQTLPEQADISTIGSVLDIASGSGEWAIATAQAYPHMQVVGLDNDARMVESARAQAKARGVDNVHFTIMDPFQRLDVSDGSFELVNARFINGLILAEAWPKVLQEFWRVTRPGGRIRLTEGELPISSNPAFANIGGMLSQALYVTGRSFSPEGRLLSITPALQRLLQDAGFQNTQQVVYVTNFSAGMEAHTDLTQNFSTTYRLVQDFLRNAGVTTQEEVEQLYQQMEGEMRSEDFCAVGFYLTVWGKKP